MSKQYHILNGDSLKEQFPDNIEGEIIVTRECLVDGNVKFKNLDELFETRAKFMSDEYAVEKESYYRNSISEFQKIINIDSNAEVNLWFEDDLFCQVNLWFVLSLLMQKGLKKKIFLIRPQQHTQYGFGGLNQHELSIIYKNRMALIQLEKLASLWGFYQDDNSEALIKTAQDLVNNYPFILNAVQAHLERKPKNGSAGRPIQSLITIMEELDSKEFGAVFKEFSKREAIYGFGDLQVKRLYDEILNNR